MEGTSQNEGLGVIPEPQGSVLGEQKNGEAEILGKIQELPVYTRREVVKGMGIILSAILLASCAPKPVQEALSASVKETNPTPIPEIEKYAYVRDPKRLNINDFIKGVGQYPNAIVERSPFATNDRGEPLFIRYGGQFSEVTYLHSTGQIPPVVGEILPLMYKVPTNTAIKEIEIVPYAISTGAQSKKVDLNDGRIHYVIPIITTGTSNGIVQKTENGQVINQPYQSIEVVPDSGSESSRGFVSWAVLTEINNEVVVEGVATSNSGIYIDPNNIPKEVSQVTGN